jgi:hypothetical protein
MRQAPPRRADNPGVGSNRIRFSLEDATALVERAGLVLGFPSDDLVLPSLWEAAIGDPEVTVFERDERTGKRVLTQAIVHVWSLKNRLGEERLACVGKHVRGRLVLIALGLLPALYALTGRPGRPDDFRQLDAISPLELELAEALLELGPQTGPELRRVIGALEAKASKRALESLQRSLVVTQAGEQEQDAGWDAAVFDLVARRYGSRLRRLPPPEDARSELVEVVLRGGEEISAADAAAIFGFTQKEASAILDRLADEGRAARRHDGETPLWIGSKSGLAEPRSRG